MKTIERTMLYNASSKDVFECMDDLGVTGMHMTESSMPMMGGKMNLEFLTVQKSGLNTKYRWTGKVLWMNLDFTVQVIKWIGEHEKTWETIGNPKMIIYSWFRMHLKVEKINAGSTASLSISYEKPNGLFNKIICFLFGHWYSRWCLKNMLNDTEKRLSSAALIIR
jgi:hypothetical protein